MIQMICEFTGDSNEWLQAFFSEAIPVATIRSKTCFLNKHFNPGTHLAICLSV